MATQLLGPLEMTGPEGRVRIGGSKERLVLALLVLRAGEVVSRDALVDALWGDDPPATAVKTMQGYVARVRKALDAAGMPGVLTTRAPGYVLDASSHATDVGELRSARERRARGPRRRRCVAGEDGAEPGFGAVAG